MLFIISLTIPIWRVSFALGVSCDLTGGFMDGNVPSLIAFLPVSLRLQKY